LNYGNNDGFDFSFSIADCKQQTSHREATTAAIGIHPFVVGTPGGAEALRRVLENFKDQKLVWVTDVGAVLDASAEKQ
jgi:peptidoglycan/xylan/chitin deacetylase (PgdA/CDA1 family)